MTSIGDLLDRIDTTTNTLTRSQPDPAAWQPILDGWPNVADAAARALLGVPLLDGDDQAATFRALIELAHQPRPASTVVSRPMVTLTRAYRQIGQHLAGQPLARGLDTLHAQVLQARLTAPVTTLASWTLDHAAPHAVAIRSPLTELTRHTTPGVHQAGTHYTDLGSLTDRSTDPVLRAGSVWASGALAALQPDQVSTSTLRSTLGDLNITLASAYFLTKAMVETGQLHQGTGMDALGALWDARDEWRIQAREFPRDIRLGDLVPPERNASGAALRDALRAAFHDADGDWLPLGHIRDHYGAEQVLRYARVLTGVAQQVGLGYVYALGRLPGLPVMRRDPDFHPVFPVGTDMAKVRRERWLPVAINDRELRLLGTRSTIAASQTARALSAVRETALDWATAAGRAPEPDAARTAPRQLLTRTIAALDAMIPATPRNTFVQGTRPAWAHGTTPPESIPDTHEPAPTAAAMPHPQPVRQRPHPSAGIGR